MWVFVGCHGNHNSCVLSVEHGDACTEAEETVMLSMQDNIAESDHINSWFTR